MREALPNRRQTQTFKFEFAGIKHHCSVSHYADGRPAEIFIDAGKVNTGVQNIMRDGAILISLALQHGCPVETLRHAMTRTDTEDPASALGKLLDLVGQRHG
jgi:hypothetical protein